MGMSNYKQINDALERIESQLKHMSRFETINKSEVQSFVNETRLVLQCFKDMLTMINNESEETNVSLQSKH
jgi:hypothetical protein